MRRVAGVAWVGRVLAGPPRPRVARAPAVALPRRAGAVGRAGDVWCAPGHSRASSRHFLFQRVWRVGGVPGVTINFLSLVAAWEAVGQLRILLLFVGLIAGSWNCRLSRGHFLKSWRPELCGPCIALLATAHWAGWQGSGLPALPSLPSHHLAASRVTSLAPLHPPQISLLVSPHGSQCGSQATKIGNSERLDRIPPPPVPIQLQLLDQTAAQRKDDIQEIKMYLFSYSLTVAFLSALLFYFKLFPDLSTRKTV